MNWKQRLDIYLSEFNKYDGVCLFIYLLMVISLVLQDPIFKYVNWYMGIVIIILYIMTSYRIKKEKLGYGDC